MEGAAGAMNNAADALREKAEEPPIVVNVSGASGTEVAINGGYN
jgi:hypothetical protein